MSAHTPDAPGGPERTELDRRAVDTARPPAADAVQRADPAPHGLALTPQAVPAYEPNEDAARGGYVLFEAEGGTPQVVLIATGHEVQPPSRRANGSRMPGCPPGWCRCRPRSGSRNSRAPTASGCCRRP
ncbi:hypothetical protein GCM10020295_13040 [Streptomyces cinereospinus]